VDIDAEKRWKKRLEPYTKPLYDAQNKLNPAIQALRRLHTVACWVGQTAGLYYAMIAFELLKWSHVKAAWGSVYWIGHVTVFALIIADIILPRRRERKADAGVDNTSGKANLIKMNGVANGSVHNVDGRTVKEQ